LWLKLAASSKRSAFWVDLTNGGSVLKVRCCAKPDAHRSHGLLTPMIAHLTNLSFETGIFPLKFKVAQITPILKKSAMKADDPTNYPPISNLSSI